ncbi:MAG: bifunctional heptose 7-phosphate kinase/heptose 1-phosphate adenyltransferase [Lishizhenia sp.]
MNVNSLFNAFENKSILVIGDVMIDAYVNGTVSRVSPEAPVPIINFSNKEERLGGAANVALNLKALGANPILCSVIGNDEAAGNFNELLEERSLPTYGMVQSPNRKTTVKTRVIGNNQHLLRIDSEDTHDIDTAEEEKIIRCVEQIIASEKIDAIIFEDYNKGLLTEKVIRTCISMANEKNIITTVDPKKKNFFAYKEVTLFKPNLKELKEGLNVLFNFSDKSAFEKATSELLDTLNCSKLFVTLSEHGVFIQEKENKEYVPAHIRNIADVSGAGDTVISVATLCLTAGCTNKQVAEIANLAGGLVCESVGVVSIDKEKLRAEVTKLN